MEVRHREPRLAGAGVSALKQCRDGFLPMLGIATAGEAAPECRLRRVQPGVRGGVPIRTRWHRVRLTMPPLFSPASLLRW